MRAMSRRKVRMRPVLSTWPLARWKRRLNCSFFMPVSWVLSSSGVLARKSSPLDEALAAVVFLAGFLAAAFFAISISSQPRAADELCRDRQLRLAQTHGFLGGRQIHAVDLEQDAARLDLGHPEFRRTLARAHADFGRLLGHRNVREDADPDAAGALHLTGDGAAGGFDLARVQPLGLQRLQAIGAEVQRGAGLGGAVDTALELLAEFCALG